MCMCVMIMRYKVSHESSPGVCSMVTAVMDTAFYIVCAPRSREVH